MIFEWDDFGCNHEISDICQSHDCRDQLERLRRVNPAFKATLFAIPAEMTVELLAWSQANADWIELGVHGFFHQSNYECEKMSYEDFDYLIAQFAMIINRNFKQLFRAPGWQISDGIMKWLQERGWILADQGYNDDRRPKYINAYVNYNGHFQVQHKDGQAKEVEAYHGHVWNVGSVGSEPNGIYEDYDKVEEFVRDADKFQFVSELFEEPK